VDAHGLVEEPGLHRVETGMVDALVRISCVRQHGKKVNSLALLSAQAHFNLEVHSSHPLSSPLPTTHPFFGLYSLPMGKVVSFPGGPNLSWVDGPQQGGRITGEAELDQVAVVLVDAAVGEAAPEVLDPHRRPVLGMPPPGRPHRHRRASACPCHRLLRPMRPPNKPSQRREDGVVITAKKSNLCQSDCRQARSK
jgi:hypothetical protein